MIVIQTTYYKRKSDNGITCKNQVKKLQDYFPAVAVLIVVSGAVGIVDTSLIYIFSQLLLLILLTNINTIRYEYFNIK